MAVLAQVLINVSTGFINVIGEALIVEISKVDEASTSKNVATYLSLTALSMLFSSYLGGILLDYITVRQIFLIAALFPIVTLISGIFVSEKKNQNIEQEKILTRCKSNMRIIWVNLK